MTRTVGKAVTLFRRHRAQIGLVLLDVQMPVMDGPQTLKILRGLEPAIRGAFMTGYAGRHAGESEELCRVQHLLCKPFIPRELLHLVEELASRAAPCLL